MNKKKLGIGLIATPFVAFVVVIVLQIINRVALSDGGALKGLINIVSIVLGIPMVLGIFFIIAGIIVLATGAKSGAANAPQQATFVASTDIDSKPNLPPQQ